MFGKNKILPPLMNDGSVIEVKEIFSTFQGEGIFVGYKAIFIRLSGCNLACKFCDTDFEASKKMPVEKIMSEISSLGSHEIVVITGGEPFRQNIQKLCEMILAQTKMKIQIETNGTLFREIPDNVSIVCSPKPPYRRIRQDLLQKTTAIKFIISASKEFQEYSNIADVGQDEFRIPVYLQPMDEYDEGKNLRNRELVIELGKIYGARISLQIHKILGIG